MMQTFEQQNLADSPPGYEDDLARKQKADRSNLDIYDVPVTHPFHKKLADGKVLFRSSIKAYRLPVRPRRVNNVDGHRQTVDAGHVIQFEKGEFWADGKNEVKTSRRGTLTEVAILRLLEKEKHEKGTPFPFYEVTKDQMDGKRVAKDGDVSLVDLMQRMPLEVLRGMFTLEEVDSLALAKASKDKLIIKAISLRKAIPAEWQEGKSSNIPKEAVSGL